MNIKILPKMLVRTMIVLFLTFLAINNCVVSSALAEDNTVIKEEKNIPSKVVNFYSASYWSAPISCTNS